MKCDTHIHVYDRAVPAASGTPMPGHFDVAMYRELQRRLGLVAHAPQRMLWASNWPHPSVPPGTVDDLDLLNLLEDWAPRAADRRRILVDNPAELYAF